MFTLFGQLSRFGMTDVEDLSCFEIEDEEGYMQNYFEEEDVLKTNFDELQSALTLERRREIQAKWKAMMERKRMKEEATALAAARIREQKAQEEQQKLLLIERYRRATAEVEKKRRIQEELERRRKQLLAARYRPSSSLSSSVNNCRGCRKCCSGKQRLCPTRTCFVCYCVCHLSASG